VLDVLKVLQKYKKNSRNNENTTATALFKGDLFNFGETLQQLCCSII
jgi:hypothetical protein